MLSYIAEAWAVLMANRTRTLLTLIGLVVGVAAIIAVQISAAAMSGAVSGAFKGLNTSMFFAFPKSSGGDLEKAALHLSDIALIESIPGVRTAIPFQQQRTVIRVGHNAVRLKFGGESDQRFSTAPLAQGRVISLDDVTSAASVCVISSKAFERLFPSGGDVIGQSVLVGDRRYVIIGVLGKTTIDTASLGFDVAADVTIPYTTYYNNYQRGQTLFGLEILPNPGVSPTSLEPAVKQALSASHSGAQYQTFDFGMFFRTISGFFGVIGIIVGAVGGIALLVAGIGIMNIMLVSVMERTREIGVRKAIGAKGGQVLLQFFIEALLLSSVGSGIGLLLGVLLGWGASALFISKISGVTAPIPWFSITSLTMIFAAVVTIVFGTYPAFRASRLDPIEALRYE